VNFRDELEKAARGAGLRLVALPSDSPSGVADAAFALTQRGIDAICQINDNLHGAAFPAIVVAARQVKLPIFSFSSGQAAQGAAVVLSNEHCLFLRYPLPACGLAVGATPGEYGEFP
jgi:ABC-type uncharacterized transport system substrate-binding protein